ncbi:endonuclease V [Asanoa sp. NPDC050611]|uniref:endonuclease V n=1 Tax=Asanoa sp. NPDC050611 TaxID=3157098 RepID=UPI003404D574
MTPRYAAVDAHYPDEGGARAALVVATEPRFATLVEERVTTVGAVPAYRPGFFFERELPAIRAVLATTAPVDLLVVDGYVDLDPAGRPGLGARLHAEIDTPVVGVAKTAFRSATHALPVVRGGARPLYVTAAGIPVDEAAALVSAMAGAHRIPDALRRVDRLARSVPG